MVSEGLVSALLTRLEQLEQIATAAGHGFGHLGLRSQLNLNAGWTRLDLTDNVRPTYDQHFLRTFDPESIKALCRAHRQIIDRITAIKHKVVVDDCWYTCAAATEERDGDTTCRADAGPDCDCGRDALVEALLRDLAVGLGVSVEEFNG